MKVKLAVVGGRKAGMEIPISTPTFVIGRDAHCHLRPQNNLVGQIHCQISVGNGAVAIEDGSNAIGTFVNGEKIKWRRNLKGGDRIKVGALELEVRVAEEAAKVPQVRKARSATIRTVVDADGGEANILRWVKQEEVASLPPKVVTFQYAKSEKSLEEDQPARESEETDQHDEGFEWDGIDLLLLSAIGPLALVLLSFVPAFWLWQGGGGLLLAGLASVFVTRASRTNNLKLDELNIAIGVLAALVLGLMLPTSWMWQGGAAILLVATSLVLGLRVMRTAGNKWDETNVALFAVIGLIAFTVLIITLLLSEAVWLRLDGVGILLVILASVLWFRSKHLIQEKADRRMLLLAAIGIFLITALGFLFPIVSWWPEWLSLAEWRWDIVWSNVLRLWSWFRWQALRNWWCLPWLRWGMVAFWVAVIAVLLLIRARRESVRLSRG